MDMVNSGQNHYLCAVQGHSGPCHTDTSRKQANILPKWLSSGLSLRQTALSHVQESQGPPSESASPQGQCVLGKESEKRRKRTAARGLTKDRQPE